MSVVKYGVMTLASVWTAALLYAAATGPALAEEPNGIVVYQSDFGLRTAPCRPCTACTDGRPD